MNPSSLEEATSRFAAHPTRAALSARAGGAVAVPSVSGLAGVDLAGAALVSDTAALRKARGAFFTPAQLCEFICGWAVRRASDRVLEPSCGDAAFLTAAAAQLTELGASSSAIGSAGLVQLVGVELHADSADTARQRVEAQGWSPAVTVGDFFEVPGQREFDVVVGNPPYVRYQGFTGSSRAAGRQAALRGGVGLTALASSWAAFTVHAAEFLRPGGRLGLVLPAELLTVNYAASVRRYLMEQFGRVRLVMFTERVFPGVLEEVVLLLAEDALASGGTDHCELLQVGGVVDLVGLADRFRPAAGGAPSPVGHTWRPVDASAKWTPALLSAAALEAYSPLAAGVGMTGLQRWGDTSLGAVTGRNEFFALTPAQAKALRLRPTETVPLSPPGSRHLRGLSLTGPAWAQLGDAGARTLLFRPGLDRAALSAGARRHIAAGEAAGIDQAYKCRVRSPWWQVPILAAPDLFLTYMNADTPRLSTNTAGVRHLNSVHGVYLEPDHRVLGRELLPLASLNTVTLLGAELVGRAYGGGMLKLEPREADQLPVPTPALIAALAEPLRACRRRVRDALTRGDLLGAVRIVDQVVLRDGLGVSVEQHTELVTAHAVMSARRVARGAAPAIT